MEELWMGFPCKSFQFEGMDAVVVMPQNPNGFFALKTEYWGAFPEAIELPLLNEGFYLCYIKNGNRWGVDSDIDRKARFVRYVQEEYGLKTHCVPIGMSCGGLIAIKFAAKYPELVSCLYLDAPVLNYMSCPCGFGIGKPLGGNPDEILNALSLSSVSELLSYRDMPIDKLPYLIQNKIPVVMVAGDSDQVVPYCENGYLLEKAYKKNDIAIEVYIKPGADHHPHGWSDSTCVLQFIKKYCI